MLGDEIRFAGISKYFGGFAANREIDLALRRGEIHAVLGENGAGKSTLMNILSGVYRPDAGEIFCNGAPLRLRSPGDAARRDRHGASALPTGRSFLRAGQCATGAGQARIPARPRPRGGAAA